MDEKTYLVTLYGPSKTREAVTAKLNRYFRRRTLADVEKAGGRELKLRNHALIVVSERPSNGNFIREPFIEMKVTATETYMKRSEEAVRKYARNMDLSFDMSVEPLIQPASKSAP